MTLDWRTLGLEDQEPEGEESQRPAPGKVTLTSRLQPVQRRAASGSAAPLDGIDYLAQPVQRQAAPTQFEDPFAMHLIGTVQRAGDGAKAEYVHTAAARGLDAPASSLPHLDTIQRSFGHHDVAHVQAHVGGAASDASTAMGATAYASGNHVGFASAPDLHTAAHEAAHTVQQKGGVQLKGGVGDEGDSYERHADAVADKVVAGESAEALLDQMAGDPASGATRAVIQHKKRGSGGNERRPSGSNAVVAAAFADALDTLELGIQARDYFSANQAMNDVLVLLPGVDSILQPGPAQSAEEQTARDRLRSERERFTALVPKAPTGGPPSDEERQAWVARTPAPLAPVPELSRPRPQPASPPKRSTEHAPVTSDVPLRPDDKADRAHEEYLGRHWDQIRGAARRHFATHLDKWKVPRLAWAGGVDAERRAAAIVDAIFPPLHISGQLENLVAPDTLGPAIDRGLNTMQRPGEGDGDASWNAPVGTAIASLLELRLAQSMEGMGGRYVAAYDAHGGAVNAADLPRSGAMDGVVARLLTQELVRVMGPLPKPERTHGVRKPRKWHWLGKRDAGLWNWIEVTEPGDATAEDVVLLLPPDVPPHVEGDGRFFRMPEDWARTQPGAAEFAPSSATVETGTELASSVFAMDAAIVQADGVPRTKSAPLSVDARVEKIAGDLQQVIGLLGDVYAERVVPAYVALGAARSRAGDRRHGKDIERVLIGQDELLSEVLIEIEKFFQSSYAHGRNRSAGPVQAVLVEFALAAGNSHLYDVGRRHLKRARTLAADVGRRLAEEAVTANGAGADKLAVSGGAGADDARARQRDRFDQLDSNAPDPGSMNVEASIDAFLLHTQSVEEQLDAMANALFATNKRMATIVGMPWVTHAEELGGAVSSVRDKAQGVRLWMIERLAQTPSAPARQALLERAQNALAERISATQIVDLSRRVVAMLEKIDRADRVIQIVSSALLALSISLIAAGAGMAVQAALTPPAATAAAQAGVMTLGRIGAAAGGLVTEAFVGGWLQSELLGDKPGEAIAENFLAGLMALGALRAFDKVTQRFGPFTAENVTLWERLGGRSAKIALNTTHVTLQMALGAGAGYAAQSIVRSPVQPTEDEALQWAMQGASIVASHWIMSRLTASRTRLQEARARVPADAVARIDATLQDIDNLHQRAADLADNPVDQPQILELFGEHHRLVGAEAAVSGAKDDGADGAPAAHNQDGQKTRSGGEPEAGYVMTVLTLAKLEQVAPGRWQGDEASVHRLVANKRALALVEDTGADGEVQWSVTTGGKKHTIKIANEESASRTRSDRNPRSEEGLRENRKVLAAGEPGYNAVVGYVDKESAGIAILQRLMRGDVTALSEIGYEVTGNFDPSTREWGLGRFGAKKYVIVAGEHGAVDWSVVQGVTPVGHSHPIDPDRVILQEGKRLDVRHLIANPDTDTDLVFSSPSDIRLLANRKVASHTLALPYEHLGGTEITLASQAPSGRPPIVLVLENARALGPTPDGATRFRATASVRTGNEELWHGTIDAVYPPGKKPSLEFNASVEGGAPTALGQRAPGGSKTKSGRMVDDDDIDPLTNYLGEGPESDVQIIEPLGKEPHQQRLPVSKDVDPTVPPDRASSGFWADENAKGNTLWFSDNQKVNEITSNKPIRFKDGYPVLDTYAWETVYLERMVGSDADFGPADIELARRHRQFKRNGQPNQQWAKDFRKANLLTWHHHQDGVRMQLVPFDLHSNIPHAGGASAARGDAP